MRADICETGDADSIERFRAALKRLGANLDAKDWALGVEVYRLRIGSDELTIFSDAWSIDVEGPDALVHALLREYNAE